MNQRKQNKTPWYSLGIALLLVVACLVTFTGTSLARFRAERTAELTFVVGAPEQIYLGKVVYPEETDDGDDSEGEGGTTSGETDAVLSATFEPSEEPVWEIVDGVRLLEFAVANGASEESYAAKDQQVKIRLIGSLGLWDGTTTAKVTLYFPLVSDSTELETTTEENQSEEAQQTVTMQKIVATATLIKENSPLYQTFGEGWVFTFLDADGEELYWTLDGGMLSFIEMKISVDNAALTEASLLKLQVIGETIQD